MVFASSGRFDGGAGLTRNAGSTRSRSASLERRGMFGVGQVASHLRTCAPVSYRTKGVGHESFCRSNTSLAIAIGGNVAAVGLVNTLLLWTLPIAQPHT